MATLRNLMNGAPNPQHHVPPVSVATLAQPAAPAAGLAIPALPGFLTQLPGYLPKKEDLPTGTVGPYLFSASTRSEKWAQQAAAGARDGDFMIGGIDGKFVPVMPLRFHLLTAFTCRSEWNDRNDVVSVKPDIRERCRRTKEHVLAVVAVVVGDRLIAAKAEFVGAKHKPGTVGVLALNDAADPTWLEYSEAHKVSGQFPLPAGRFLVLVGLEPRTSKTTGRPYIEAVAQVQPSQAADMQRFARMLEDETFRKQLAQASNSFSARKSQLERLAF